MKHRRMYYNLIWNEVYMSTFKYVKRNYQVVDSPDLPNILLALSLLYFACNDMDIWMCLYACIPIWTFVNVGRCPYACVFFMSATISHIRLYHVLSQLVVYLLTSIYSLDLPTMPDCAYNLILSDTFRSIQHIILRDVFSKVCALRVR